MPHLHIREFKEINFPNVCDEVRFNFIANNLNDKKEKLISVNFEDNDFFLVVKQDNNKTLIKTDKLTRPSSTYIIHKALLSYAKIANLEIISSNVIQNKKNIHLKKTNALKEIEFFASNFPVDKEIRIEIGFGSGRHLLYQANKHKDILFIGLEIHRPSIEQVLKQINIQKLDNILLLDYDARLFMEMVPSNLVGAIYVHFPVPWDKKPHRRVISKNFIKEAKRVLKIGATLELRTDSEKYYTYSYESFISFDKITLHINKNKDIEISSKYEDRWKRQEKNIYDIIMINDEHSNELVLEGSFAFLSVEKSFEKLKELDKKTKKFEDGFVHVEKIYDIKDGIMLRLSLGSFDRPEHLYVIIQNKKASYYPKEPLRSKANLKAHDILKKVLHG